ncbi:hypothetical protein ABID22_001104 [Pontibacter aydingkolensis]|uniref:Uncharacterized protein n=1 Tax=Pontibacter aydingkolensis TaxID=1911536 RepID=A0ABS7CT57_9BACT|nr:hypothetical protein [Pontibacter aydingkolensis]MBW7467014.1 hypothetical protein [Pontibacter aydingkolensis]
MVPVNGMIVTMVPEGGGEAKSFTMSTPYTDEDGKTYGEVKEEHIVLQPNTTGLMKKTKLRKQTI